jgi:hypothetical protein
MSDYDNTNSGFIGKNSKKETEKHPDITGFCEITEPGEYWISGWKNSKGYGLRFKRKEEKKEEKPAGRIADMQDDIPF